MTKEALEKEVRDFLRQQFHLNGGGKVSCNLEKLLLDFAEPREKRIADFEKKVGVYQTGMFDEIEKRDKKLTEAKEIIKELMITDQFDEKGINELYDKAEQFLKKVEK